MKYTIIEVGASVGAFVLLYVFTCGSIYVQCIFCLFLFSTVPQWTSLSVIAVHTAILKQAVAARDLLYATIVMICILSNTLSKNLKTL